MFTLELICSMFNQAVEIFLDNEMDILFRMMR